MANIIEAIASFGGGQPSDELNHAIGMGQGATLVDDAIFRARDPTVSHYYDDDCRAEDSKRTSEQSEPLVQCEDVSGRVPSGSATTFFMPPTVDYNAYARENRSALVPLRWSYDGDSLDGVFAALVRYEPDRTMVSDDVLLLEDMFYRFVAVAQSSTSYTGACDYAGGVIAEMELDSTYIISDEHDVWRQPHTITTVRRGGKRALSTFCMRTPSAVHLRALLAVLVKEYHFEVDFVPHEYVLRNIGVLRVRYTATTLILLYGMTVTLRMLGRAYSVQDDVPHGWFGFRSVNDLVRDITRRSNVRQVTYKWEDPVGGCHIDAHAHEDSEWSEKMVTPLPVVTAYSDDGSGSSRRYNMWYQEAMFGGMIASTNINLREQVGSVDVQFCTQLHMDVDGTRVSTDTNSTGMNLFDGRRPMYERSTDRIVLQLPVARVEYEVVDAFKKDLVVVEANAMVDVRYRYYSDAFVKFTYRVNQHKTMNVMQIFDARFSSDDATFALQTMEFIRTKLGDESLSESVRNTLLVRMALFSNIGRVPDE